MPIIIKKNMGIKHFSLFMNNHFKQHMHSMPKNMKTKNIPNNPIHIDNIMIDMNGIFHTSAQKIYKYGNFKPQKRLLKHNQTHTNQDDTQLQHKMFDDVCTTLEYIMGITQPSKRIVLCVDGPAPLSKQNQQRQRRFKSVKENTNSGFDSTCITPGTEFMDSLNTYIDWYIHTHLQEWNIEVVFSSEKVPGEGEHKLINYIRKYGNKKESYCIYGLDADLIMLALGTHHTKMYVLRDDLYNDDYEFMCIDIQSIRKIIIEQMRWNVQSSYRFDNKMAINDFIFLCFMTGNDFLPNIPSIEIIQDGIELILRIYRETSMYGHITKYVGTELGSELRFNPIPLSVFFNALGKYEKENIDKKINKRQRVFPDPLLDSCTEYNQSGKKQVCIDTYRATYNRVHFGNMDQKTLCHSYLEGMQWVISYYINGISNWKWFYPFHYSPFASALSTHCCSFKQPPYKPSKPTTPFQQLLCVLPPSCSYLLPHPLSHLLSDTSSPLKKYCPDTFEIDLSGKRKEWEGTVILPMVDFKTVESCYKNVIKHVHKNELKRDKLGSSVVYVYMDSSPYLFKSKHGNVKQCNVHTINIQL